MANTQLRRLPQLQLEVDQPADVNVINDEYK